MIRQELQQVVGRLLREKDSFMRNSPGQSSKFTAVLDRPASTDEQRFLKGKCSFLNAGNLLHLWV